MIAAQQVLSVTQTVLLTFGAAAFGSFLAFAFQAYLVRRGSRSFFATMKAEVKREVDLIESEATERSTRGLAEIKLDPPYPTLAWRQLLASPEARRLKDSYGPLAALYRQVDTANHRLAQIGTLLSISAMAQIDDVRLSYRDLAQQISAGAHQSIVDEIRNARAAITKGLG